VGGVVIRESASVTPLQLPDIQGKGKAIATNEQAALSLLDLQKPKKQSTTDRYILQRRTPVTQDVTLDTSTRPSAQLEDDTSANVVRDIPSPTNAETGANTESSNSEADTEILEVTEERGDDVSNTIALVEITIELDEGQAGSDPGNTLKSQPPPDGDQAGSNPGQSHVDLVG
ncbi:hypothetical protein Tco_0358106, partial [Tanacetum coccineum]